MPRKVRSVDKWNTEGSPESETASVSHEKIGELTLLRNQLRSPSESAFSRGSRGPAGLCQEDFERGESKCKVDHFVRRNKQAMRAALSTANYHRDGPLNFVENRKIREERQQPRGRVGIY